MGIGTFVSAPARKDSPSTAKRAAPARGDMILVAVTVVLSIFGIVMVNSASPHYAETVLQKEPMYLVYRQLLWFVVGIGAALVVGLINYHIWQKLAVPMMVLVIGALIGVLVLKQVSGESLLRSFFGGSVQPSEFAKIGIVIYLSVWLNAKRESLHDIQLGLIPMAAILGVVGGLIFIQPDLSAGATILILGVILFFLAGGDLKQFVIFIVVAVLVGILVMVIGGRGQERLDSYVAGLSNPKLSSDQVRIALEAIVRGGIPGEGLGQSQTKLNGLPVPPTDSIFAVLVEELGLIGGMALIGLYGLLLWRGMRISQKAPDMLGSVMAAALTFWIVWEAFMNMAFIVGLMPVTGSALPFISYGGSSLVCTLTAVGILFSISRQTGARATETGERRTISATADLRRRDRRRRVPRTHRA